MRIFLCALAAMIVLALAGPQAARADCHHATVEMAQGDVAPVAMLPGAMLGSQTPAVEIAKSGESFLSQGDLGAPSSCHKSSCCEFGCGHMALWFASSPQMSGADMAVPVESVVLYLAGIQPQLADRPPRS